MKHRGSALASNERPENYSPGEIPKMGKGILGFGPADTTVFQFGNPTNPNALRLMPNAVSTLIHCKEDHVMCKVVLLLAEKRLGEALQ